MDKYYTPTIEEFHHGFIVQTNWDNDGNWKDDIYDNNHGTCDLAEQLNMFRVKYLDREDVESCGWKYIEVPDAPFTSDNYYSYKDVIEFRMRLSGVTTIYSEDSDASYFIGGIKNKSELKKLMSMLNIK